MESAKSKIKLAPVILIIASLGLGVGAMRISSRLSAHTEPSVVATVDGKQIPAKVYRMYLKNGIEALGLNDKTQEGRWQIELLKDGIVSELIDRCLIEAEVTSRKLPLSEKTITEAYEKTIVEMGGRDRYLTYLSEHALTEEEFRQTAAQEVCGELLRAELDKEVAATEDEERDFFNKEQNNPQLTGLFKEPERVHARHILIGARRSQIVSEIQSGKSLSKAEVEQQVAAEMANRRDRATAVLNRLRRGAGFQRLAAEDSDDVGTKSRGGDLGLFTRNTHTARFDEAAFALKPGQPSDIVETEYGYHIIEVTEHTPERSRTFDEARPAIEERVLAEKRAAHLKAWLEDRRRHADIHIDPFYRTDQLHAADRTAAQDRKEQTK